MSQQPKNWEKRDDPHLVQAFPKKWCETNMKKNWYGVNVKETTHFNILHLHLVC